MLSCGINPAIAPRQPQLAQGGHQPGVDRRVEGPQREGAVESGLEGTAVQVSGHLCQVVDDGG